ncbi:hypothetical protein CTDIVETGP_1819 [Clostridium tyrobutyricum DIVETGP]|uniref:Uncharacterized protein n=1 Tax=Clostridium tyrobutyricum DIVETGP TaxID=1408889 RepID=W6N8I9_CLOTY|nr:hypothetical protein CTK_C26660 [Clostridium tyrobutyricum]CDL91749.1 hypothetical protein CTDIVETGP_1819 [Clostridium tyrobutyricum DIVETGP]
MKLCSDEIHNIVIIGIEHSFLRYKKELVQYGYEIGRIFLKEHTVILNKIG